MVADPGPTRSQGDLAEMLDTLLDKGVVVNADVAVSVGDTELLGIELRAAIASFETAAEYGLAFPAGTDVERMREAAGIDPPDHRGGPGEPRGIPPSEPIATPGAVRASGGDGSDSVGSEPEIPVEDDADESSEAGEETSAPKIEEGSTEP